MNHREYSFERLMVWQNARRLSKDIYLLTRSFPSQEKFGLISQMRRAAVSVASNLAEGSARITKKDKAHFSTQSFSSLMELLNQVILCFDLEYIDELQYQELRAQIDYVAAPLSNLRKSQLST